MKKIFNAILIAAVILGFTTCNALYIEENFLNSKTGNGAVLIIFGDNIESARTIFPSKNFDNFVYTFSKQGGDPQTITPENGLFNLEIGNWNVRVDVYIDTVVPANLTAFGTADFSLAADENKVVPVILQAVETNGYGTFFYHVQYPTDTTLETFLLTKLPEGSLYTINFNSVNPNAISGTENIPFGIYQLELRLANGGLYAGTTKIVHIYNSLLSEFGTENAPIVFTHRDFSPIYNPVAIRGITAQGQTLTADTTYLSGTGTISYQWKRGDTANDVSESIGSDSASYILAAGDVGKFITVTVSREGIPVNMTSVAVGPVSVTYIEMVWIPAGTFIMGSNDSQDWNAQPAHTVTLTQGFYMGKYEVTQAQWAAVMGSNPSHFSTGTNAPNRPVESETWYDIIVFCNRLSIMEGLIPAYRILGSTDPDDWGPVPTDNLNSDWDAVEEIPGSTGYRLPTEAQWEYAARAGTITAWSHTDVDSFANHDPYMWYSSNSGSQTQPIGTKLPNAWGLHDMHGNVFEWVWDWYGSYPNTVQTDPRGAVSGDNRVIRGESWDGVAQGARSAFRIQSVPYGWDYRFGFRVVRP